MMPLRSFFLVIAILLLMVNCTSIEQFNKQLEQPITVKKLQEDINYTQQKLEKYYPSLYTYISKEQLNYKFDSIRKVVSKPMTSKEFYFVISPVIASVRQGHMTMSPVLKRLPKKEAKRIKKAGDGPLSQFVYEWNNNKLYVTKSKSKKNRIKEGAEVISINSITPQSLYSKYKKSFTSDGLNTTFLPKFFSKRVGLYLTNELGINDSLTFVFKQNDSLLTKVISRNKPVNIKIKKEKDSTIVATKTPIDKGKLKALKKRKKIYGYDKTLKEYSKSLKISEKDSSVAILKLKNFSKGKYEKAYERIFDTIKKAKIQTLVIDLRDNPGGRVADVVTLYSYLSNEEYTILKPAIVTSKTSLWRSGAFNETPKIFYPFLATAYPFYMGFTYFRTTKNDDGTYHYKLVGSRKRKPDPNHFEGKIYVLINGGSFSASCILSSSLKSNPKVRFVGEETGGAFNGTVAGIMPLVKLPNSNIPLRLGLMDIQTINQTDVFGRGIFPDKVIIPTIEDKVNGKDPEMDWILNEIGNSKN